MLKMLSEQSLLAKLTIETAVELFDLADLHSADKLKAASLKLIDENIRAVMKTKSWDKVAVRVGQELRKIDEQKEESKEKPKKKGGNGKKKLVFKC